MIAGGDFFERLDAVAATADRDDPAEVALGLSALLQARLVLSDVEARLAELTATVAERSPAGVCSALIAAGFDGDRESYHSWRNSCLDQVIVRRRGMPITLAVLAIAVGRRAGVPLVGVGMPGHFLLGDPGDASWFADPFNGRWPLSSDDCRALYESIGGDRWSTEHLRPIGSRAIALRILNNLSTSCTGDAVRLAIVAAARRRLSPRIGGVDGPRDPALAILN